MIVYGDVARPEPACAVSASILQALHEVCRMPPGIDRHAAFVSAFIRAGELAQGIADAAFERSGLDARSPVQDAGSALLLDMAAAVDRSWRSGFAAAFDVRPLVRRLESLHADGWIKTRAGEGYAHYALYPESYLEAARASGLGPETCVIGIRSIGTSLAALVAAALGAPPALSLRPIGHPFDREIRAAPDLLGEADRTGHFAVVDEGPGLSGSSFASVATWLAGQGVEMGRIHFLPSHEGEPGEAATSHTRLVWQRCPRHPASGDIVLRPNGGLRDWLTEAVGPLDSPLQPCPTPPSTPHDARFARPKFLARGRSGPWLVKFAGLGPIGEQKFHDAEALARAGFGPRTPALCYGFLVQQWVDGTPPTLRQRGRPEFLKRLAAYLAFRASRFKSTRAGASLDTLRHMAIVNIAEALGKAATRRMERRLAGLEALEERVHPVRTDNRLHRWEWLASANGILKLDAVDHCRGHDLVGCQDIAWDVAGAIVEHDLEKGETALLCRSLQQQGVRVDRKLLAALLPCYLAFQLGLWSTATNAAPGNAGLADGYARKLFRVLQDRSRQDPPTLTAIPIERR
jgi:hypothetical protein